MIVSTTIGFTPDQVFLMLYRPFEAGCPVQLRTLTDEQIEKIPIMRQALRLMGVLSAGEMKLTARGYIPPKLVEALYLMGTRSWLSDSYKLHSEPNTEQIQVLRIVLRECGLIKTRLGEMSLTAKGKKLLADKNELLRQVMTFMMTKYNVAWLDSLEGEMAGNEGRLYSLWLLHHFGDVWRHTGFYTHEYATAFPALGDYQVYDYRVFNRLFRTIGLCEINDGPDDRGPDSGSMTIKTEALDMLFEFTEPKATLTP